MIYKLNIVLARKPLSEKSVAENVLKHGTGGINIDGSRIKAEDQDVLDAAVKRMTGNKPKGWKQTSDVVIPVSAEGRFPANIIFDEEAGKILDQQSGNIKGGKPMPPFQSPIDNPVRMNSSNEINRIGYGDEGGASRFFYKVKNENI